ncbi:hypothetical protein LVB87_15600 [Lysobacter sp. KIS68-7]|uniref:hypothetical protein n=1 Tax=Lysobacter sp. KIS68-7 TaxID=2904252 RepID=UPI001E5109A8|nr:hypothetical protein [Lysobacter sp. KIS68-7]UHQ19591.1 hypothetical protein LVB87_15600 [Lysobacter sp. KIS68-7]
MTICAYCGQDQKTTREHVIPAFLYAFQKQLEQSVVGWNEVANKMVDGEVTIKDVCAECNNGVLGQLDAYGKQVLTESGLLVHNYERVLLPLRYNYSLLLRWLLKMSFNSSRMGGAHASRFYEHIPFILGHAPHPPRYKVAVVAYLAAPELISKIPEPPQAFLTISGTSGVVNPFFVRLGYGLPRDRLIHRPITLGAAIFHVLLFNDDVLPGHAAVEIRSLTKAMPGAIELDPKRGLVEIRAGTQTWLDLHVPQATRMHATGARIE